MFDFDPPSVRPIFDFSYITLLKTSDFGKFMGTLIGFPDFVNVLISLKSSSESVSPKVPVSCLCRDDFVFD